MTRHQIHLKNLKKLESIGYYLRFRSDLMKDCFGVKHKLPSNKGYIDCGYRYGYKRGSLFCALTFLHESEIEKEDKGEKVLFFKTWKDVGNYIHQNKL